MERYALRRETLEKKLWAFMSFYVLMTCGKNFAGLSSSKEKNAWQWTFPKRFT